MANYMTAKEAAIKWKISQRRVSVLCKESRIKNAELLGNMWIIPASAIKPIDKRRVNKVKDKTIKLKPFVKWAGGKGQLIDKLLELISVLDNDLYKYAEPFVGGGALLFNILSKYNFKEIFISDNNEELINAYKIVRDNIDDLIAYLMVYQNEYKLLDTENRKVYYYNKRDLFNSINTKNDYNILKAALFIFLNKTCFNGLYRVNKKGEFNVPIGDYKNPLICDKQNLINVSKALQGVEIKLGDFSKSYDFIDNKTIAYLDPPYRPLSNTSNFTSYTTERFGDNDQKRLAEFIKMIHDKRAKFILSNSDPKNSNSDDNFFNLLYNGFKIKRVNATRMVNSRADKRGCITELIITNINGEME